MTTYKIKCTGTIVKSNGLRDKIKKKKKSKIESTAADGNCVLRVGGAPAVPFSSVRRTSVHRTSVRRTRVRRTSVPRGGDGGAGPRRAPGPRL